MKILMVALVFALGCSREPRARTSTIAPADARPGPAVTSTIGTRPVIDTSGSPRPPAAPAPGTTFVIVENGRIGAQRLLPRGHMAFHLENRTAVAHQVVVSGGTGSVTALLGPQGTSVLQLLLGGGAYEITCTTPGHRESARFETYAPGAPLEVPGPPAR